ncbi:MAG: RNA polymerase sigma factor [Myxococcales bacterium]|nr:RNA polymerase sigma factor [Myxococcales bacterium]
MAAASADPSAGVAPIRARELDDVTLRRAQRRDPAAWRRLVEVYQAPVFALLGRMVGGGRRSLVEDLAQDTFLAVLEHLPTWTPTGPARLSTWILTIASRRAIDALRRHAPVSIATVELAIDPAPAAIPRRELAAAIERAVGGLPPEYRAAFLLRELHGLDYEEIALALAIELGTVRSRLARARQALRRALAEVAHG